MRLIYQFAAIVLCAVTALLMLSEVQGQPAGRRTESARGSLNITVPTPTPAPIAPTPYTPGTADKVATPTPLTGEPKEMIALTLWTVTLSDSKAPPADELTSKLDEHAHHLPVTMGKFEEVQDLVGRLKMAGLLKSLREVRLVALDGGEATLQTGANMPQIVATNQSNEGRSNSIAMIPVGTKINVQAKIDSDNRIQVRLDYKVSDLIKSKDVAMSEPKEGPAIYSDVTVTQQLTTTARVSDGMAVLIQSDAESAMSDDAPGYTQVLLLGAEIVKAPN